VPLLASIVALAPVGGGGGDGGSPPSVSDLNKLAASQFGQEARLSG
jgi:hypothetical protein